MTAPPESHPQSSPLWDAASDYIRVVLRDVEVETHVGLHPWERHPERPSRLLVTVEMFAHLARARAAHGETPFIDYDRVRNGLRGWSTRPHTPLLETLAEELVALCFADAAVEACRVSVVKPDIFNDAAGAGVEIYRVRPRSG
ncbi:MAG TPA: dihydroneopterin aldolase [Caulobacteraceae bacterium]|nr:dihydroneopterin aldolase [Caulobacteraceae bacterium]